MASDTWSERPGESACQSYYSNSLKKKIYTQVDEEPEFPGGAAAYQRFLNRNLKYPQEQIDNDELQLTVIMKFIVDINGQIKIPTVHDKDSTGNLTPFEKEVLRLINLMPKWVPGKCHGKVVAVAIKRPMMIHLEIE
jgi:hypothetical protein